MTHLSDYRDRLEARQSELTGNLGLREELAIHTSPDMIDEMQSAAEREFAVSNLVRAVKGLREVRDALRRIEDGSYGVCLGCDEPIPARRLEAVPWAACCVSCQEHFDHMDAAEREAFVGVEEGLPAVQRALPPKASSGKGMALRPGSNPAAQPVRATAHAHAG